MEKNQVPGLRSVHRALADPMRLRLLESLWVQPQSAKELAEWVGIPTDRIYYHLAQLEKAGLIEVAEYRPLPGGKVERVYRGTPVEPPGNNASPLELSRFLGGVLEATQTDITSACMAKEEGKRRQIHLLRTTIRLSEEDLLMLRDQLNALVRAAQEKPDGEGAWTRVVVTLVDLEDRDQLARRGDTTKSDI